MSNRTAVELTVPDVAHIILTGPTQCGKSVVMARIERFLQDEFGAKVVSPDLDLERNLTDPDSPKDWEKETVRKTIWVLSEA